MSAIWDRIFGTAWAQLSKAAPEIGAFVLNKKDMTAEVDNNLPRLLDIRHAPEYEELSRIIAVKTDDIIIVEDNEDIIAGFVVMQSDISQQLGALPLCSQAQFASALSQASRNSLLALIRIEDYFRPVVTKEDIRDVLSVILGNTPEGTLLAAAGKSHFWLYIKGFSGNKLDYLAQLQSHVRRYTSESNDSRKQHRSLTFSAGCGAEGAVISERMQTAEFTLFDAAAHGIGMLSVYSDEKYEQHKAEYENMRSFTRLINENLFVYHFQPIVSARNGAVVAYEALMRTDKSINMYPLEILGAATKLGRLYDIEKATLRNTLAYISENQEVFADRKLFVNSIPAHILSYSDWEQLVQDYGELMEKMVIEMTESSEVDDDMLAVIHDRLRRSNISLAIDDYGTGYSNTSNLLRYRPEYVKIDRSLIEGIDEKPKVQKLVSGIIEFIHENGYSALAEGVETAEELKTMIMLGSDLIQGYYISKPKPFALHEITESLQREIVEINLSFSESSNRVYNTSEGGNISLSRMVSEHYGSIFVDTEEVVIEGTAGLVVNCPIIIRDGLKTKVTLRNAQLTTDKESPVITLGMASELQLELEGSNEILARGIWVPQTTAIRITGEGSLYVKSEIMNSYGIGVDKEHSPGNITVECTGKLTVESNGENAVAIGGGKNISGTSIQICAGDIHIICEGGNCVAIGNHDGNSVVDVRACALRMELNATNAVGIGSLYGKTDIYMYGFRAEFSLSGLSLCAVGSLNEGKGRIDIDQGTIYTVMRGRCIACIGSIDGSVACVVKSCSINFDCEGGSVSGIGDITGSGDVTVKECGLDMLFLSKEGLGIGSRKGMITVENCNNNIRINE